MKECLTLFGSAEHAEFRARAEAQLNHPSRMIRRNGFGPTGATCGICAHLRRKLRWYKCALLGNSNCTATDVRLKWPACGKFEGAES